MKIPGLPNIPDEYLASCDQEPIHVPGKIQPHGALLAFSSRTGRLCYASQNAADLLAITSSKLAVTNFDDLVRSVDSATGLRTQTVALLNQTRSQRVPLELPGRLSPFDIEGHLSKDGYLVLEIEQVADSIHPAAAFSNQTIDFLRMKKTLVAIESKRSFQEAMESIARQVREITRYDRVMIYRFDSLGHGEILIDNRRNDLESFLGLHYPASDIPKQARELYLVSRVRQLVDTKACQSNVLACDGTSFDQHHASCPPLDMSICNLRSFSPIHIQYLENMGVRATLVISVILDGKLWGLIVCHHMSPKKVSSAIRLQCDLLSHVLSAAIQSEERRQHEQDAIESQACYRRLEAAVKSSSEWKDHLFKNSSVLLDLLQACGVVWMVDNQALSIGKIPTKSILDGITSRLARLDVHEVEQFQVLDEWLPTSDDDEKEIAGYAAVAISKVPASYLVWFREGQSQTITWGGDPRKNMEQLTDTFRLLPRTSFEKWRQELAKTAMPWTEQDILRAKAISLFFGVKQVEDANRTKSQFLANMSHEIRTPMTAILGYTDILIDQLPEGNDACREAVETISRNGHHLLSILNDLLDLAKIEAGKLAINREQFAIGPFLSQTIDLVAANAQKKNIELVVYSSDSLPDRIHSDPVRLRQVLLNLLSNSIKFTLQGSVSIRIDYVPSEHSLKDRLIFEVSDTGIGMSAEILAKLFQQFEQGDVSITRKHGGTGLGLVISRHLVESMDGTLVATSKPGIGSKFTAEFLVDRVVLEPGSKSEESLSKAETDNLADAKQKQSRLKVLVAEDGPDNQRLIQWMLQRKMNADVTIVENGILAIEAALASELNEPFELVLMDMQMPEMDGLSATRKLRSLNYSRPVIALTAHASAHDKLLSLEAGCGQHVCKPIVWDELYKAIEVALGKES